MNFNVALLNDGELGKELGKKGTSTDFTLYNYKQGDDVFCFFDPHQYPDKIQSLINVLMLTDSTIIAVKQLDSFLGEMIVALDLMGKDKGLVIFDEYVERSKFTSMVGGATIEKFIIVNKERSEIYEKLQRDCSVNNPAEGDFMMSIDAFFDVKSVGTVVLGVIKQGKVAVHDELQLYPSDKRVSVRSLQVHDEDVKEAPIGSRVGLALKGVNADELERGMLLAKPGLLQVGNEITVDAKFSKYHDRKIEVGGSFYLAIGLQYRQSKLIDMKDESGKKILKFQMQSPAAFFKKEKILIVDPGAKARICGVGSVLV